MISLEAVVIFPRKSYQHLESPLTTTCRNQFSQLRLCLQDGHFGQSPAEPLLNQWLSSAVLHGAKYCAN